MNILPTLRPLSQITALALRKQGFTAQVSFPTVSGFILKVNAAPMTKDSKSYRKFAGAAAAATIQARKGCKVQVYEFSSTAPMGKLLKTVGN
jgi:hypothetical protein